MREMKNSGVEWIGEIPGEWIRTSLLNVLSTKISDGPHETPILLDKGIPFISVDSLNNSESIDFSVVKKFISEEDYLRYYKKASLTKGDILFSKAATIGKTAIVGDEKFMVWSPIAIIKTNMSRCNNIYIYYILYCSGLIKQISLMGSHNTQINVGMRELEKVQIPVPSLPEQHRIADFLDEKCAKIDAVIEKQKQVIEKLKEYKLSVITEAVTKGLDPTVPMKDSGVEWIGDIPEGWKITKLSRVCKTSSGSTPARNRDNEYFLDDAKIRWVRTLDLNDGLVYDSSEKISNVALLNSSCSIMPKDTVCVAMYGGSGTIGKCGILQKECATNQAICSIVCDNKIINPYYMFYQMISSRKYWMKFAVGTRKDPNISQEIVANAIVVAPSLNIQSEIIGYLNNKCSVIDSAIVKKQSIVEKLTEYKKSLIYEVITGKREV